MMKESVVERVVRATNHVREALLAGYTTYRDLGSEGMESFDANLRDCINRGLLPGPRLFVATHALASTGSYAIRTENSSNGVRGPQISDACDGEVGVRRAVRRRVADGADIIKFYADYRRKMMRFPPAQAHPYVGSVEFPPSDPNPQVLLFSQAEMDAIVREAQLARLPVACHAGTRDGAMMAVRAGVTSIEHCFESCEDLFLEMRRHNCIFVPTLAVAERMAKDKLATILGNTKRAFDLGVRLAAGGDTGTFPHGENAREMELMIEAGIPVEDVLEACTVGGWEACGGEYTGFKFGWFEKGCRADIIALKTDPRIDSGAFRKVSFAMKDGKVWKRSGEAVGIIKDLGRSSGCSEEPPDGWVLV
jgi:imidazolonepropionase-like amidohydrolase